MNAIGREEEVAQRVPKAVAIAGADDQQEKETDEKRNRYDV